MRPPSVKEIAAMTSALTPSLTSRAVINRPTTTPDGAGGQTTVWNVLATGVPCFYSNTGRGGEHEQVVGTRIEVTENWVFLFYPYQDVKHKDQIAVDGRSFEVGSVSGPSTVNIILTVGAEEIL